MKKGASQLNEFVNRKMSGLKNRILNSLARAVLQAVDDAQEMQEVKVEILSGEVKEGIERFQDYGMTSNPPDGSECVAMALNGNRDHTIIIKVDNREFRLKSLAKGEVALYNNTGSNLILKANGDIEANPAKDYVVNCAAYKVSASSQASFTTPLVSASALMQAQTDVTVVDQGTGIADLKAKYNSHTHIENGGAGPTETPVPQI